MSDCLFVLANDLQNSKAQSYLTKIDFICLDKNISIWISYFQIYSISEYFRRFVYDRNDNKIIVSDVISFVVIDVIRALHKLPFDKTFITGKWVQLLQFLMIDPSILLEKQDILSMINNGDTYLLSLYNLPEDIISKIVKDRYMIANDEYLEFFKLYRECKNIEGLKLMKYLSYALENNHLEIAKYITPIIQGNMGSAHEEKYVLSHISMKNIDVVLPIAFNMKYNIYEVIRSCLWLGKPSELIIELMNRTPQLSKVLDKIIIRCIELNSTQTFIDIFDNLHKMKDIDQSITIEQYLNHSLSNKSFDIMTYIISKCNIDFNDIICIMVYNNYCESIYSMTQRNMLTKEQKELIEEKCKKLGSWHIIELIRPLTYLEKLKRKLNLSC